MKFRIVQKGDLYDPQRSLFIFWVSLIPDGSPYFSSLDQAKSRINKYKCLITEKVVYQEG